MILSALMMEAIHPPKAPVPPRASWHHIPEDGILQDYGILKHDAVKCKRLVPVF
jgi:hypothetical protein